MSGTAPGPGRMVGAWEPLGGIVTDHHAVYVTVGYWHGDSWEPDPYIGIDIEGSDDNDASFRLCSAEECRKLKNMLAQAERRLT